MDDGGNSEDATTCKDEFLTVVILVIGSDDVPLIDGDIRGSDELSGDRVPGSEEL